MMDFVFKHISHPPTHTHTHTHTPQDVEVESEKKKKKKKDKSKDRSNDNNNNNNNNDIIEEVPSAFPSVASSSIAICKNFYKPHAKVLEMSEADVESFRSESTIDISSKQPLFNPILKFKYSNIAEDLLASCKGFEKPTCIQSQAWPVVLSGHDGVFIAATGSGKTLAFGLPGLVHVRGRGKLHKHKPFMLVIAPTRELAMQTAKLCDEAGACASPPLRSTCIYGGVPKDTQRQALKQGVHVLIATPGRLIDLMEEGVVDLSEVSYCVLDEADRMLDMGFERDVRRIVGATRSDRQTLMFSATWPVEVQGIASSFMTDPVRVTVGSTDLAANRNVKQVVEVLEPFNKDRRLLDLLKQYHASRQNRVLIFALYKKEADRVEQMLRQRGFAVEAIHGDKTQGNRSQVLEDFRSGKVPLMIATDVAARGLDIPQIEVVINYTFPLTVEDYVHRIGRTGRAGHTGMAHTFFTVHDKAHAGALGNVLREAGVEVPAELMKFGQHTKKKVHKMYGDHFKEDNLPMGKATHVTFDD